MYTIIFSNTDEIQTYNVRTYLPAQFVYDFDHLRSKLIHSLREKKLSIYYINLIVLTINFHYKRDGQLVCGSHVPDTHKIK